MRRTLPLPPVLSILALACAQLLWVGCGDGGDPAGVSDKTLATVGVEPSGVALTGVGATHQFSAEGYNRSGQRLTPPVVTWSSLNPFVATVDSGTGRVTPLGRWVTAWRIRTVSRPFSKSIRGSAYRP